MRGPFVVRLVAAVVQDGVFLAVSTVRLVGRVADASVYVASWPTAAALCRVRGHQRPWAASPCVRCGRA